MKSNDSETIWNERMRTSRKQQRLNRAGPQNSSVEDDLKVSKRMAAVGNDSEMYNLIFGAPGEYPAFE